MVVSGINQGLDTLLNTLGGYNPTTMTALNGYQMWIPFVALDDATIDNLEIQCTTAVASSTVQLGLYSSDANNDLSDAIFISNAILKVVLLQVRK